MTASSRHHKPSMSLNMSTSVNCHSHESSAFGSHMNADDATDSEADSDADAHADSDADADADADAHGCICKTFGGPTADLRGIRCTSEQLPVWKCFGEMTINPGSMRRNRDFFTALLRLIPSLASFATCTSKRLLSAVML